MLDSTDMWSTPAVWKQYNKIAVSLFSSKFHSNKYSILFDVNRGRRGGGGIWDHAQNLATLNAKYFFHI